MFETLVGKIVKGEKRKGQVDVSLVNDKVIKVLNRKFRKKDKATDVLAFPYSEGTGTGIGDILGDVIISRETARKNARHFGFTYQEEIKRLVIHGTLHVLGYDHGRRMSRAEKIYSQF